MRLFTRNILYKRDVDVGMNAVNSDSGTLDTLVNGLTVSGTSEEQAATRKVIKKSIEDRIDRVVDTDPTTLFSFVSGSTLASSCIGGHVGCERKTL